MRIKSKFIALVAALSLVVLITFLPHELQTSIIDFIVSVIKIMPIDFLPPSDIDHRLFVSNLGHVLVFFTFGYTIGSFGRNYSILLLSSFLVIISLGSEMSQLFVLGREASISDLVIDISAACAGLITFIAHKKPRRRSFKSH